MDKATERLLDAVAKDDLKAIREALAAGADILATDAESRSPMHIAAINSTKPQVLRLLAACGCSIGDRDAMGRTPLHWAGLGGNKEIILALLALGADRELRDRAGQLPLIASALSRHAKAMSKPDGITET